VSREELVERYLDGQLSRRVFIRRLVLTGVTTAAALSYASILETLPANATVADFYLVVQDFAFRTPANLALGQNVQFASWSHSYFHTATDTSGMALFDTGPIRPQDYGYATIPSAGSYAYQCSEPVSAHPKMKGKLQAPVVISPSSGNINTTFTVTWAAGSVPAGFVVDVQSKAPGSTAWTTWQNGVSVSSATRKFNKVGQWSTRARLRRFSNNKSSGWSTATKVSIS
jgi:plastocyanin